MAAELPSVILLVEDNPITRKMLRFALETEGYEVDEAADGRAALEACAARRPDLLVLDYVLPDIDGLTLLADVRRHTALPELPAIVVTGMVSRLEELRAQGGASTLILGKPVEPSRLLEVVRAQLESPSGRPAGRRILVVDDEPLNRKLAAFRLKQAGYEVDVASGGTEGLELARRRPPNAIITDVMMPGMDGFALCREARSNPRLAAIPIVLVSSAYVDEADRELARKMGANALVLRTPDLHAVIAALEEGFRGSGPPPVAVSDNRLDILYRERLQVQLERQTAQNEALLRQAAIQATALSIIRGLSEVLAQPKDVTQIFGDVLVHCLDAAGLSTGFLYVAEPVGRHRLQAQFGLPAEARADAEASFGHPELLQRIVEAREPVAFSSAAQGTDAEARDFLARVGHSSVLILPFVVLGETFGVLVLASDSHDLSESAWIGFARSLALQFGQTVALGQSLKRVADSEGRYRALMEHAYDAIFVLSPEGVILEANNQAEGLLALPRDRVIGRHIAEFAPDTAADGPENVRRFREIVAAGRGRNDNVLLRRGDGALVEVDFSLSVNEIGGEAYVLSIGRDVTERSQREQQIRLQSRALEATTNAIVITDIAGAIVWVNPAFTMLTGYTYDEAIGRNPRFLRSGKHDSAFYQDLWDTILSGRSWSGEMTNQTKDGTQYVEEMTINPVRSENGPVSHFVAIKQDVTERKRTEEMMVERARLAVFSADVNVALTTRETLRDMLQGCCQAMVEHLGGAFARIWTLSADENVLELQASAGIYTHLDGSDARVPVGKFKIGLIAQERQPHLTNDVLSDPHLSDPVWARREGMVAFAGYPLVVEGELVGVAGLFARQPLTEFTLKALSTAADSVALGIQRKKAEKDLKLSDEQLRQAQKMEAVGQLAGGVAHDFNNLLGVITGYSELLLKDVSEHDPRRRRLDQILRAAGRAAALTRQLLAFSRKQVLEPRVLDLNAVVAEIEKMLRRVIGENIQLVTTFSADLGRVKADAGQVEQVIMNLAVNARDAISGAGRLIIETANAELDQSYARNHASVKPGAYVLLSVSDTGHGMDAETRSHIFEPFFTTKEVGKGTGLGLATVYGIVRQSGGHVSVYSEPGQGSTFKVYLPRVYEEHEARRDESVSPVPTGSETVLLVEDDASLCEMIHETLDLNGYRVLEASNPDAALEIVRAHQGPIPLVVTDVVMPHKSGHDLAVELRVLRPEARVLYMSGYADQHITQAGVLEAGAFFLQKPFTTEALLRKVREVLEAPPASGEPERAP